MVVEGTLEGALDDHLGYGKHDPATVMAAIPATATGPRRCSPKRAGREITVPGIGDSSFEPRIVAKRQRRLTGVDDLVISLSAKGLTHGRTRPACGVRVTGQRGGENFGPELAVGAVGDAAQKVLDD